MAISRADMRKNDELRPVSIENNVQPDADSSLLIRVGKTHVICAVTIEESVPQFLKESGYGWITAEYGMLPCSASARIPRESVRGRSGRTFEIQRLIGRSLRMMIDLKLLGERTLRIDCDVIRADGGTRTAAITGAALAVREAIADLAENGLISKMQVLPLAAVSVGLIDGQPILDLTYEEDSRADVDANFIMTGNGSLVEVQCTAEGRPFSRQKLHDLTDLGWIGISRLLSTFWQDEK